MRVVALSPHSTLCGSRVFVQSFLTTYCASKAALGTSAAGWLLAAATRLPRALTTAFEMCCMAWPHKTDCVTKNTAHTLKADGIRVNGVQLGWCFTDQEEVVQLQEKGEGWREAAEATMATGRMLRPEDAASLAAFLLSDASTMMTGSLLDLFPEEAVPGCYD